MLNTLLKLGEQLSKGRSRWDDIIEIPETEDTDKKGNPINNYVLNIIFDLDNKDIIINNEELYKYDKDKSPLELKNLKTELWGRNGDPWAICTQLKKIDILKKSLLGKEGQQNSLFLKAIDTYYKGVSEVQESNFVKILRKFSYLTNQKLKLEKEYIKNNIKLGRNNRIILVYISVISKSDGIFKQKELSKLSHYNKIIENRFIRKKEEQTVSGFCYVTGEKSNNTVLPTFTDRLDLNKIFVLETRNFANEFNKNNFAKNYSIDINSHKYIERASDYLRKNMSVQIAGINHNIIPEFLCSSKIEYKVNLPKLQKRSELLFQANEIEKMITNIEDDLEEENYWLNYVAYDIDGNSIKLINLIKDVNKFFIIKLIEEFISAGMLIQKWDNYFTKFNFSTIYYIIPVRKSKKNIALTIFTNILEQRKIEINQIYKLFTELILCHKYKRYDGYSNIYYKPDNFDFAIKDAVFKYLAFIQVLKKLNLLKNYNNMENINEENLVPIEETSNDYQKQIESFFNEMAYNDSQKSLFYLGRVLSSVAYAQYQKKHESKPILNKLNYNGMDRDSIVRLRKDLAEKAKQYNIIFKTDFNFSRFTQFFNFNNWIMKPEEAIFFILSGYSFGMVIKNN